jgi:hypothetical protein
MDQPANSWIEKLVMGGVGAIGTGLAIYIRRAFRLKDRQIRQEAKIETALLESQDRLSDRWEKMIANLEKRADEIEANADFRIAEANKERDRWRGEADKWKEQAMRSEWRVIELERRVDQLEKTLAAKG